MADGSQAKQCDEAEAARLVQYFGVRHLRLFDADKEAPFFRVRNSYERTDGAGAFVVFDCSQPNEFETHVRCGNIACNV